MITELIGLKYLNSFQVIHLNIGYCERAKVLGGFYRTKK